MTQPSLTDFLIARLAEDEAVARAANPGPWVADVYMGDADPRVRDYYADMGLAMLDGPQVSDDDAEPTWRAGDAAHIARHDPARVLADVEAKRKIVERCAYATQDSFGGDYDLAPRYDLAWDILCDLASVYADHPDYRAEWRQ